ncbi:MAG: choice-of-anchor Q domain-containing protein [Actinomycetota bacterium]
MRTIRLLTAAAVLTGVLALAGPASAATISVNTFDDEMNTDGDCSLREALASANDDGGMDNDACADGSGPDTIALPAGTYLKTTFNPLDVTSPVTIDPTGTVVIDGNGNPLFEVNGSSNLTISDLTLRRGSNMGGGAVLNDGTATLIGVTLEANIGGEGGGVANTGTLTVRNSTFSGNEALANGGGLYNEGTATLNNVTLADNVADSNADGTGDGGGIRIDSGTVNISNTIVGDNRDQSTGGDPKHADCSGTLTSAGYNLIEDVEGCTIGGVATGNITSKNPQLFPLDDNGGPTRTHALRQGSDAVDAGNPAAPGSSSTACETTDQRGTNRPQGPRCDMGAFELEGPPAECQGKNVTISGTSGSDVLTGTGKKDVIRALGGDDVVDALGGNDRVCAGGGNDQVKGRAGNDQVTGGAGNDRAIGAGGGDTLSGQGGKDRLKGKGGNDALKGGPKPDKLNGGGGTDICQGGGGKDQISHCEG